MTRSAGLLNRFLVSSDYSAYYRILNDLRSDNAPTSDYTLITSVSGKIEYTLAMIRGHIDPQRFHGAVENVKMKRRFVFYYSSVDARREELPRGHLWLAAFRNIEARHDF